MTELSARQFILTLICLTSAYLGFEWWFNQYAMISVDEFWFAHRIYEYHNNVPYRDFSPYKTVLGYYLLLLPMSLAHGIMPTLIFMKNVLAVTNVVILVTASCWLTRFFSRSGILCSLLLLFSMEIMLSFSTNIRVDLLAYWFCLFSLLCLLDQRYIVAGLLLGLGFATSQKAIWYMFASNTALGVHWLIAARNRHYFLNAVKFNLATIAVIVAYLIFWSAIAGWPTIYNSVFVEASAMYHLDWYNSARLLFWSTILVLNPLAFTLWPLALLSLMITFPEDRHYSRRRFVIVYAFTILLCLMPYKQVFPYYMQVTLPVFLVLYAAFFTWLLQLFQTRQPIYLINKPYITLFNTAYILGVVALVVILQLPYPYLLISIIPLLLNADRQQLLLLNFLFIGLIYPAISYTEKLWYINGNHQKANISVMNTLLNDNSDYVAGIELIYNKTQPIAGLRHLMGPAIDYLYAPSEKLRSVMTAALYEDPNATAASVIAAIQHSRVKFYVNNYRMDSLPPTIKNYLENQYQHLWGSIYLYAPSISNGRQTTLIKFNGEYKLQASQDNAVTINNVAYTNGAHLQLSAAPVTSEAAASFRLVLVPKSLALDPEFKRDDWAKIIF